MNIIRTLLFPATAMLVVFLLPVTAMAEVYKWTDKDGNVHFSDRPTSDAAEQVKIKSSNNAGGSPQTNETQRRQNQQRLLRAFEDERRVKRDRERKQQEQADIKQRNCVTAKDNYRQYKNAGHLYELNKQGERVILNDQQHRQAMQAAQARIARWCDSD